MVCSGTDELTSANKKVTHERQRNITEYRHKNKKQSSQPFGRKMSEI